MRCFAITRGKPWRWRLLMIVISIVALTVGVVVQHYQAHRRHAKHVAEELQVLGDQLNEESFGHVREDLGGVARMPFTLETLQGTLPPDNPRALAAIGSAALASDAELVYLLDGQGTTVACTPYGDGETLTGENYGFRPYFLRVMNTGRPTFYAALGVTTGRRGVYVSVPVFSDGEAIGVVVAKLGLRRIDETLQQQRSPMALVSPDGVVFATNRPEWMFKTVLPMSQAQRAALRATRQFGDQPLDPLGLDLSRPEVEFNDGIYHVAKTPIMDGKWMLLGLFHPPAFDFASFAASAFLVWLIAVLVSYGLRFYRGLRASNRRFDQLAVQSGTFTWEVDTDGLYTHVSRVAEQVIGYRPEELIGKKHFYDFHPQAGRAAFKESSLKMIRERKQIHALENPIEAKDGSLVWVSTNGLPLVSYRGRLLGYRGSDTNITHRRRAEAELKKTHRELLQVSRRAGMSEIATGILHNVGNALNSVNVTASLVTEKIQDSRIAELKRVGALVAEHAHDLGGFVTKHPQGQYLADYFVEIGKHLDRERSQVLDELDTLRKNIEHIKQIVAMQQAYARVAGVAEEVSLRDLIEDTLHLRAALFGQQHIQVLRDFEDVPTMWVERHKVMQILANLIANAGHAITDHRTTGGVITIRVRRVGDGGVRLEVSDDGIGIAAEDLSRVFRYGFTTKDHGHGFGLHSSALAAKELGGSLTARSDGKGKGATFVLELPLRQKERTGKTDQEKQESSEPAG